MASSIDTYLKDLSYSFYLKKDSFEVSRIKASLDTLLSNIDKELGHLISERFVFGSYDRDTILPRNIDSQSDIDVMVIFNHTDYERSPETYRAWLKNFADKYYKSRYGSEVIKSFPTVTIKLNNIHYDLVPAKEESGWLSSTIYIPDKDYGWQPTDPEDVKSKLIEANTEYNQIVKPIIRLLKAWNSANNYPYDSYELELLITGMNFNGDNIQSGFFYAVRQLSTSWLDSQWTKDKINSLKYNIEKAEESLQDYNINKAKQWLHRVLPGG